MTDRYCALGLDELRKARRTDRAIPPAALSLVEMAEERAKRDLIRQMGSEVGPPGVTDRWSATRLGYQKLLLPPGALGAPPPAASFPPAVTAEVEPAWARGMQAAMEAKLAAADQKRTAWQPRYRNKPPSCIQ